MNQLSASFRALKQTEFEKLDSIVTKPLIRFYPNQGRLKSSKKQAIELSINPTDDLNENTFKTDYHVFDHGTVEDLIEWKKTLSDVIKKKHIKNARAKFHMTRNMLDGAAEAKFNTVATRLCNQPRTLGTANQQTQKVKRTKPLISL